VRDIRQRTTAKLITQFKFRGAVHLSG